ncbi:TetR/AcrR family transcriptional regulator C-terminal domain-containing protein [Paraburkholderia phenoliruptrix]|uniref:TetR/AcrR family transcriptional regulator C-terminal domain-containing protein n=1 Tax=Paraburkholderia phenoliruptrix TaxID=252970 RepID=UPI001C4ED5EC|nr:TetR/AcrR family transcriptional regulator [Paraburkholderia phenoliruptrix]MBW9097537.1 TetR/AcrR family transcriptional regulator [Paraburkholderia phenoliruptrix]
MRTKTDKKRSEILEAATAVFLKKGFEATLMSEVSEEAKCSKGTLYSYFESKEELFYAVVIAATSPGAESVLEGWAASAEEFEVQLRTFGLELVREVYSPRFQAVRRLVFLAPSTGELGQTIYDRAVRPYLDQTARLLALAMEAGHLRRDDAAVAACHLCGLLESELLLRFLLHALGDPSPDELDAVANRGITAFLAAYRPSDCEHPHK